MDTITYEGMTHIYICRDEPVPKTLHWENSTYHLRPLPTFMLEQQPHTMDWRAVIVRTRFIEANEYEAEVYYLVWNHDMNLDELDQKIKQGRHTPTDFATAILTEYQHLMCRESRMWWHTLNIPHFTFFLTGSADRDFHNRADFPLQPCPNGKAPFRQSVIKVLGAAEPPLLKRQRAMPIERD